MILSHRFFHSLSNPITLKCYSIKGKIPYEIWNSSQYFVYFYLYFFIIEIWAKVKNIHVYISDINTFVVRVIYVLCDFPQCMFLCSSNVLPKYPSCYCVGCPYQANIYIWGCKYVKWVRVYMYGCVWQNASYITDVRKHFVQPKVWKL